MEDLLQKVCETYISNRDEMRRILRSSGAPMHLMGAAVLTALGRTPDEQGILEAERILKENEPEDSPIRGWIKSVTTVHMMLADSAEEYYRDLRRTHDLIHVSRGADDERYYMAAMMMSDKISDMQDILMLIDRAGLIHESMGKSFTSQSDRSSYVTAAFAAVSGVYNVRQYMDDVRACRAALRETSVFTGIPDELCMLLAIIPYDKSALCRKAAEVFRAIKARGMEFDRTEELAMLAFFSGLEMRPEEIADAVCDADGFLELHSGFTEGPGLVLRHVYASMLVIMTYTQDRGREDLKQKMSENPEILKRMVLMQSQSVMHIQMKYVDIGDLHI